MAKEIYWKLAIEQSGQIIDNGTIYIQDGKTLTWYKNEQKEAYPILNKVAIKKYPENHGYKHKKIVMI